MKRIIFLLLIISNISYAQPPSIPSSGAISMTQIATVMYNLGEISYASTLVPYSLSYLNSKSHLVDKTAPFSISDWYGYTYTGYYYIASYNSATPAVCPLGDTVTVYTSSSLPTSPSAIGYILYSDPLLSSPVPNGGYIIGGFRYFVFSGTGTIGGYGSC